MMTATKVIPKAAPESVEDFVLRHLGKPPKLDKVMVKPVGEGKYRVNVWCFIPNMHGHLESVSRIVYSYYVCELDGVRHASPEIVKRYE